MPPPLLPLLLLRLPLLLPLLLLLLLLPLLLLLLLLPLLLLPSVPARGSRNTAFFRRSLSSRDRCFPPSLLAQCTSRRCS